MDHWTVIHLKFIGYPKQNDVAVSYTLITNNINHKTETIQPGTSKKNGRT